MATTAPNAGLPSELAALLPVLIDEISRLKQLQSLAGIAELPVKDAVVREELAQLRSDFVQIKSLLGGAGAGSNQAPAADAAARNKDEEAEDWQGIMCKQNAERARREQRKHALGRQRYQSGAATFATPRSENMRRANQ